MKFLYLIAAFGASLVAADASISTTVVCSSCPNVTTTAVDIVTRSPVATTPCTAPALTVVSGNATYLAGTGVAATSTGASSSSTAPVEVSGGERMIGGFGGALALAAAVAYLA